MWGVSLTGRLCQDVPMNALGRALYVLALACLLIGLFRDTSTLLWVAFLALAAGYAADAAGDRDQARALARVSVD